MSDVIKLKNILILITLLLIVKESIGQYDIVLQAFEQLIPNDTNYLNLDKIKIKRFGRNQPHVGDGEFEFFKDLGDDTELISYVYKKQGQEYRKTPYHMKGTVCNLLGLEDLIMPQVWKYTDLPPRRTCPFPAGVYHVNHMYLGNLTNLPPVLESNDYMLESIFYYQSKTMSQGLRIYLSVYNKVFGAGGK
jgi:ganglioside GM2 activator